MELKKIELGTQGLVVPALGLGCMGMTSFGDAEVYGPADEQEAIATIHRALELGGNFLDTADLYGPFINEQLVAKATTGNRDKYIIATKFGWEIDDNNQVTWGINGKKGFPQRPSNAHMPYIRYQLCRANIRSLNGRWKNVVYYKPCNNWASALWLTHHLDGDSCREKFVA